MATISSTLRMIDSFSRPLDNVIGGINKTIDALEDLQNKAAKPNEVSAAFDDARKNMSMAKDELDKMAMTQERITDETERTKRSFSDLGSVVRSVGGIIAGIFTVRMGMRAFDEFRQFEKGMREVFTLLPGISREGMDAMTEQLKRFRIEYGIEAQAATQGLYQAISAGVPPQNVFEFMEIASKAAVGGVTDLTTAVDGLSSVVNAYGAEAISTSDAADMMFTAVKLGKTTFEEMSSSLYNVVPVASSLELEFSNITAAMATMTAQGVPTAQATTQMRQLLLELSKAGTQASDTFAQAAGVTFKDFISQGNNVADALALMEQVAIGADKGINDLFSSVEAGNAALALTGTGMEKFLSDLDEMKDSVGAYEEAFDTMAGSVDFQLGQIRELIKVYMEDIGQAFAPVLQAISGLLSSGFLDPLLIAVMVFATSISYVAQLIGFFAEVLAPLSPLLWGLASAAIAYVAVTKLQQAAKKSLFLATMKSIWVEKRLALTRRLSLGPVGLVIVAITAFIGVLAALMTRFDSVRQGVIKAINGIIGAVNWLLDMIRKIPGAKRVLGDFRLGTLGEDAFLIRKKDPFGLPDFDEFDFDFEGGPEHPDLMPSGLAGLELDKINKVGEVDRINKAVNIAEEDLRYLRDFAEREVLMSLEPLTAASQIYREDMPELPDLTGRAYMDVMLSGVPDLPQLSSAAMIEPVLGIMPGLPGISGDAQVVPYMSAMPELPDLTGRAYMDVMLSGVPDLPQIEASYVALAPKDAELFRRSASKDYVQNNITLTAQVDAKSEINSKVDLEKEMEKMAAKTQEEIEIGLAGLSVVLE